MCSREKVCFGHAPGNVFCEHPSVAFSELRLTGRENATNLLKKNLDGGQKFADLIVECFLEVSYSGFPELVRTSGTASSITSGLTTYHPASCVVAILSKSKTTRCELHQDVEDH